MCFPFYLTLTLHARAVSVALRLMGTAAILFLQVNFFYTFQGTTGSPGVSVGAVNRLHSYTAVCLYWYALKYLLRMHPSDQIYSAPRAARLAYLEFSDS